MQLPPFVELSHVPFEFLQSPELEDVLHPAYVPLMQPPLLVVALFSEDFFAAPPTNTTSDISFASPIDLRKSSIRDCLFIIVRYYGCGCKDKLKFLLLQVLLWKN